MIYLPNLNNLFVSKAAVRETIYIRLRALKNYDGGFAREDAQGFSHATDRLNVAIKYLKIKNYK
jgi:hypothetical protein